MIHQLRELVSGRQPLAARDRDRLLLREPAVAVEVVRPERRLEEADVELGPVADHAQRGVGVRERVLHVDEQRHLGADRLAHRGHDLGRALEALAQADVRVGAVERDLRLDRAEAELARAHGPRAQRVAVGVEAGDLGLQRRVRRDVLHLGAAEQLVAGLAERLAAQVVERHVDRADRVDHGAPPPVHGRADVEPLPQALDVEGVGADQDLAHADAHGVRAARVDAGAGDPRVDVALADPADALVGVDLDDDVVLRGRRGADVDVGLQQDMAIDPRDPHARSPSRWPPWTLERRRGARRRRSGRAARGCSRSSAAHPMAAGDALDFVADDTE